MRIFERKFAEKDPVVAVFLYPFFGRKFAEKDPVVVKQNTPIVAAGCVSSY